MAELLEIKDLAKPKWSFGNEVEQAYPPEFLAGHAIPFSVVHWICIVHFLSTGSVIRL